MRQLYTLLLYVLLPPVLLRLVWRGFKSPAYHARWSERLGTASQTPDAPCLWLHAVSFGEAQAALPLIRALQQRYPDTPVYITTTTPTGSQLIEEALGNSVLHSYLPYDLPFAIRRFVAQIRPRALIVMETEWWPNLFRLCADRHIPVILANTRLSERSARRYGRFRRLTCQALDATRLITIQSEAEARRLAALCPDNTSLHSRLHVTGNIKFDLDIPASLHEQAAALRRELGTSRPVWIAASTHEGEDEYILAAHTDILRKHPDALLILVPRHPERFDHVASLCKNHNLTLCRRSARTPCESRTQVFLGDTMGELRLFYAASDVAFVGGSLVATGGHNVLEAAALARPVIFGPHMFNFTEASQLLLDADAGMRIDAPAGLAKNIDTLFEDGNRRSHMGEAGKQVVVNNRGALDRTMALITAVLDG